MAAVASRCALCPDEEEEPAGLAPLLAVKPTLLGPLLGPLRDADGELIYVHRVCAVWTPEVRAPVELRAPSHSSSFHLGKRRR